MDSVNRSGKRKRGGPKNRKLSRRAPWSGGQMSAAVAAERPLMPGRGQGPPALHVTSRDGDLATAQLMVESMPEWIDSRDSSGSHPIHLVLSSQFPQSKSASLKYLLEHKADVNASPTDSGQTPLHLAASEGLLDCVEILVKAGADVLAKDSNGHTPLDLARIWCHRKVARYLKNCLWEVEKNRELKERRQLQALYRDLVDLDDLVTKQNNLSKKKLIDEKMVEWANKKGLAPPKDFSPRVHVSLYHTKCLLSDQTRSKPICTKGLTQPDDSQKDKRTPTKQTAAPSRSPWSIFIGLHPGNTPTEVDLRNSVTLLRDSSSRQLQYTTRWDCTPHPAPNLSQDLVERVLFPRAFPSRIATPQCFEPQKMNEVQHRRNLQGCSTCPWTEVAMHLAEELEPGRY
ncbi:ankyrin repeat domain-containing protein 53 [Xenentodon cancila]